MKHLKAQRYLIITQKHLLLEGFISNACPLITFRFAFMFSNSLKYLFLREVGTSISRVWRKHIFGVYIVSVSFDGLLFFPGIYFFSLFLISVMNLISSFTCICPRQCYEPWKISTKYFLINSLPFPSLVSFGPKKKNVLLSLADVLRHLTAHCCERLQQICQADWRRLPLTLKKCPNFKTTSRNTCPLPQGKREHSKAISCFCLSSC